MKYKSSRYNIYIEEDNKYCVSNTVTSSVMMMEYEEYVSLKENRIENFNRDEIDVLKQEGFIVDSGLDEVALLRYAYFSAKLDNREAHLTICPTLDCNFDCPYCYENRRKGSMSDEVQQKLISFVEHLMNRDIKKLYVMWYGGEPLLYPEIIKKLTKTIKIICDKSDVELIVSMISNGFLIDKCKEILREIGLSRIQITLDGLKETHDKRRFLKNGKGTYDVIVNNIMLISQFAKVTVRVNIDRTNISSYSEIHKLFDNLKNVECYCSPVTVEKTQCEAVKRICFTVDQYDEFYKLSGAEPFFEYDGGIKCCSAEMKNTYVIDPEGCVYKCLNDLGNPEWRLGDLNSIVDKESPEIVSKYLGRDPFTEDACRECVYLPQCFGGCVWVYKDKKVHSCKSIRHQLVKKIKKEYFGEVK